MSDGIGEWYKMQREYEMSKMTELEKEKYLAPKPRNPEKISPVKTKYNASLDHEGIIYGEPPFWRQALTSLRTSLKSRRKMLFIAACCMASFYLGLWGCGI